MPNVPFWFLPGSPQLFCIHNVKFTYVTLLPVTHCVTELCDLEHKITYLWVTVCKTLCRMLSDRCPVLPGLSVCLYVCVL